MQINRAFPQFVPIMIAILSLAACGEPAPRPGDSRPTKPPYQRAPAYTPPPATRPAYIPPAYTPPTPPARPAPVRTPPPVAYAPTTAYDWRDVPLPAGDWSWVTRPGGSEARYGPGGSAPIAILVCDRAAGVVRLAVPAAANPGGDPETTRSVTITTSTSTSTFVATPQAIDALSTLAVALPTSHRMLDAMAYSRGRFRIEIGGMSPVIVPSWSEVGRVVEDCRSQG